MDRNIAHERTQSLAVHCDCGGRLAEVASALRVCLTFVIAAVLGACGTYLENRSVSGPEPDKFESLVNVDDWVQIERADQSTVDGYVTDVSSTGIRVETTFVPWAEVRTLAVRKHRILGYAIAGAGLAAALVVVSVLTSETTAGN